LINPRNIALNGYLSSTLSQSVDGYLDFVKGIDIGRGGYVVRYIEEDKFIDDSDLLLVLNVFAKICF